MEELIKISELLDGYRIRKVDIIGNDDSESRYTEFFNLLREGKLKNDTEAAKYFYGSKATDKSLAYRRFKSTFRERLINTLFFIDMRHPNFNDLETATMNIQKEWAAINILFAKGDLRLPVELSERLLPIALKFELTEIVVYITDRLKNAYGGQIGNFKKYAYYKRLQKEQMEIWQAEIQAKDLYQELRIHFIKSNAHKPFVAKAAQLGLEELQPALEKYKTLRLIYYAYIAKVGQYTAVKNYDTVVSLCNEAIDAIKKKPFEAQRLMNTFLNQKLICHIQLKEYEKGQLLVEEILVTQIEGSLGWFKTLEHATLLALHTKNYEDAYMFYVKARNQKEFATLELRHLEIWHLYRGYLYFLIASKNIKNLTIRTSEFDDFRMSRFLNDTTIFGRDKQGMNIPILVLRLAMSLLDEKYGLVIDCIEALSRFKRRHMSKEHVLYRYNLFIKMATQIPRAGFTKPLARKLTEVWVRALKATPLQTDNQNLQTEIIPLENMWELLLNMLKNKR
jgi:hypothetical protein